MSTGSMISKAGAPVMAAIDETQRAWSNLASAADAVVVQRREISALVAKGPGSGEESMQRAFTLQGTVRDLVRAQRLLVAQNATNTSLSAAYGKALTEHAANGASLIGVQIKALTGDFVRAQQPIVLHTPLRHMLRHPLLFAGLPAGVTGGGLAASGVAYLMTDLANETTGALGGAVDHWTSGATPIVGIAAAGTTLASGAVVAARSIRNRSQIISTADASVTELDQAVSRALDGNPSGSWIKPTSTIGSAKSEMSPQQLTDRIGSIATDAHAQADQLDAAGPDLKRRVRSLATEAAVRSRAETAHAQRDAVVEASLRSEQINRLSDYERTLDGDISEN